MNTSSNKQNKDEDRYLAQRQKAEAESTYSSLCEMAFFVLEASSSISRDLQ